jgi:hypothetical protein
LKDKKIEGLKDSRIETWKNDWILKKRLVIKKDFGQR